jgi:hypothetical protein
MDIREALSKNTPKKQTMLIVNYIGDDEEKFAGLMGYFLGDVYRLSQRAAWVVGYCAEYQPQLVAPYIKTMVTLLERKDVHDAVKRNIVRFLQFIEIPKNLRGKTFSHCYELLSDPNEAIAIRCFSMSVAFNIAKDKPDLLNELKVLIAECMKHSPTPGFASRAKKILKYDPK